MKRPGLTPAENAWLDEVASRHRPFTTDQAVLVRRILLKAIDAVPQKKAGDAA